MSRRGMTFNEYCLLCTVGCSDHGVLSQDEAYVIWVAEMRERSVSRSNVKMHLSRSFFDEMVGRLISRALLDRTIVSRRLRITRYGRNLAETYAKLRVGAWEYGGRRWEEPKMPRWTPIKNMT